MLQGTASAIASFDPDVTGTYEIELEVSDGLASGFDTAIITIEKPCNPNSPKCTPS